MMICIFSKTPLHKTSLVLIKINALTRTLIELRHARVVLQSKHKPLHGHKVDHARGNKSPLRGQVSFLAEYLPLR